MQGVRQHKLTLWEDTRNCGGILGVGHLSGSQSSGVPACIQDGVAFRICQRARGQGSVHLLHVSVVLWRSASWSTQL